MTIDLEHKPEVQPLCPHCKQPLPTLWMRELAGFLDRRYLYFCPHCHKILGISHRKGFFMG